MACLSSSEDTCQRLFHLVFILNLPVYSCCLVRDAAVASFATRSSSQASNPVETSHRSVGAKLQSRPDRYTWHKLEFFGHISSDVCGKWRIHQRSVSVSALSQTSKGHDIGIMSDDIQYLRASHIERN
jgi:hypothetical protein